MPGFGTPLIGWQQAGREKRRIAHDKIIASICLIALYRFVDHVHFPGPWRLLYIGQRLFGITLVQSTASINEFSRLRCASIKAITPEPVPISSSHLASRTGHQAPSKTASVPTFMAAPSSLTENFLKRNVPTQGKAAITFCVRPSISKP